MLLPVDESDAAVDEEADDDGAKLSILSKEGIFFLVLLIPPPLTEGEEANVDTVAGATAGAVKSGPILAEDEDKDDAVACRGKPRRSRIKTP